MAEDAFVQMLLKAAGGHVDDERDMDLAQAAALWASQPQHGWRPYLQGFIRGHNGLEFWVDGMVAPEALLILVRLQPGTGWKVHGRYPVAHLGHALDVLAAEGLIPAQFCTIGRRALGNYAEALDRAAGVLSAIGRAATSQEIADYGEFYPREMEIRAAAMNRAADQARAFPRAELAVLP